MVLIHSLTNLNNIYGLANNHLELGIWVGWLVDWLIDFKTNFNLSEDVENIQKCGVNIWCFLATSLSNLSKRTSLELLDSLTRQLHIHSHCTGRRPLMEDTL